MNSKERPKILIVDDERANITVLNAILKSSYSILAAIDGQTAIEILKHNMPDLILLDVVMPNMSGFEVLAELKRDDNTRHIPVIFITGHYSAEDEQTGFFLGAVDYITKPFHNANVVSRIKMHIRMTRYIREIERFGTTDPLTNIPNRRSFNNRISLEWDRAIREKEPLGILMIDMDNFKKYNDTYGHPQGDTLLQSVAEIFTDTLKRKVDFVARWGGEEFIVLLPNTNLNGALAVAEHIRSNVESASVPCLDGVPTNVTVSIGVVSDIPSPDNAPADFISKADKAMYTAKNSGRNKVCPYDNNR